MITTSLSIFLLNIAIVANLFVLAKIITYVVNLNKRVKTIEGELIKRINFQEKST